MNTPRILIVEDESLVAVDLEDRLTRLGYTVNAIADNGAEALRLARERRPDLALLDIKLIGPMDGIQVAQELRAELHVPVVFLTSHADRNTLNGACATEPFGYVVKPFEESDLVAALETAFYRDRAERKLRHMEGWLAATLRSISDAVIATDLSSRVTFLNPKAEFLTGWNLYEALGHPCPHIIHLLKGPDRCAMGDIAQRGVHEGIAFELNEDLLLLAKDGRQIPIEGSVAPIRDDSAAITGAIVVLRDNTRQLRLEEERQRLEEKMREAQKLESLGLVAAGVAHDFNNLLAAIMGHAGVLDLALPQDFPERNSVTQIYEASQRAAALCTQMLAYAGRSLRTNTSVDLGKLAVSIIEIFRVSISESASLQVDCPPGLPAVFGDAGQLQQIIMNLVINASEALGGKPGQIRVTAGTKPMTRDALFASAVSSPACPEGDYVFLEVTDTGSGMSRDTLQRIFDPFFTTKFLGRGLGLAAVSGIVRAHKGALNVQSKLGVGTTFCLHLPIEPGQPKS